MNVLALLLKALRFGDWDRIVLGGDYTPGGAIAEAMKDFQRSVGFSGAELDIDGNFGPATRAVFKERLGIDVDELTVEMFTMPTVAAPD